MCAHHTQRITNWVNNNAFKKGGPRKKIAGAEIDLPEETRRKTAFDIFVASDSFDPPELPLVERKGRMVYDVAGYMKAARMAWAALDTKDREEFIERAASLQDLEDDDDELAEAIRAA